MRVTPLSLMIIFLVVNTASATEPFAYTWIERKQDRWIHLHGYLGGAAIVLDDVPNKKKERFWLSDLISKDNFKRYVKDSTAGPIWGENALAYFITLEQQPCFCIRLAWGERIALNLDTFKPVPASSLNYQTLEQQELGIVRERLDRAVQQMDARERKDVANWSEVENAISMTAQLQLKDMLPQLQWLEECLMGSALPIYADNSPVHIRRAAQFAMRRLGVKPTGYPAMSLPRIGAYQARPFDKPYAERSSMVDAVKVGDPAGKVMETLGVPDYINAYHYIDPNRISPKYWRYDMDTTPPYTLVVILHQDVVHQVRRLEPALWQEMEKIESGSDRRIFKADGDLEWSTDWERIEKYYLGYRVWTMGFWLVGTLLVVVVCGYLIRRRMIRNDTEVSLTSPPSPAH